MGELNKWKITNSRETGSREKVGTYAFAISSIRKWVLPTCISFLEKVRKCWFAVCMLGQGQARGYGRITQFSDLDMRDPWFLQGICDLRRGQISNPKVLVERYGCCLSNYVCLVVHCRSSGLVTILCQNQVVFYFFHKPPILSLSWEEAF